MNYYEALEANWNTLERDTGTRLRPDADLMELVERMYRALEATGPVGLRIPFMLQGLESKTVSIAATTGSSRCARA